MNLYNSYNKRLLLPYISQYMKRRTIWILIILMLLTFVGLIALQTRYVRINAEMIENQFNENVQRSLFQTVSLVEENEALEYLSQTLQGIDYTENNKVLSLEAQNIRLKSNIDSMAKNLKLTSEQKNRPSIRLSTSHGKATIQETSQYLQDRFKQNFSRSKTILDQAVFRWIKEIDEKEISERVNFEELNGILEKVLVNNGVTLPLVIRWLTNKVRLFINATKTFTKKHWATRVIFTHNVSFP